MTDCFIKVFENLYTNIFSSWSVTYLTNEILTSTNYIQIIFIFTAYIYRINFFINMIHYWKEFIS